MNIKYGNNHFHLVGFEPFDSFDKFIPLHCKWFQTVKLSPFRLVSECLYIRGEKKRRYILRRKGRGKGEWEGRKRRGEGKENRWRKKEQRFEVEHCCCRWTEFMFRLP